MPGNGYRKPKGKVAKVYREKEMVELISGALKEVLPSKKKKDIFSKAEIFLAKLSKAAEGGDVVVILEQQPLHSEKVQGKWKDKVYCFNKKTKTQYWKEYVKASNPQTEEQQAQRMKYMPAVEAWRRLPVEEKEKYKKMADKLPMSGYNLFVSKYLRKN